MSQRLVRLVGAGVPLTDAFQAVVEEIIDNGPADFDTLTKRVQSAMYLKEKRILSAGWRTWQDFTRDILDQISGVDEEAVPTLMNVQGKWSALEFRRGVAYTAIRQANITYTVWDEETRLKRDMDARMLMDVKRQKGDAQAFLDRYPDAGDAIESHLKNIIGRYQTTERLLSGDVSQEKTEGTVQAPRGSEASGIMGPLGWARVWLADHPGEWRSVTVLRDMYVKEFGITAPMSMGSIGKGLAKDAVLGSAVQRRQAPNGRAVQYMWRED